MNADKAEDTFIPFNKPFFGGKEFEYMRQAIERGHISGDGEFTKSCRRLLEEELEVPSVLLTTSGTHALEMAAMLLEIEEGDEVILPSFTFVSTANAFVRQGARPIFCDIRRDTLNIDENHIEGLLTERTKAIVPVHYAGVACEMDAIKAKAELSEAVVVEDNAHGIFGRYKGKYLGTLSPLAALSFHETKNFSCGEGGALLINDESYLDRAEIIREKGTDRARFFRGQSDKYTWVDIGSSYLPSDLLSAFLLAQLEKREDIQNKRCSIWNVYYDRLSSWAKEHSVSVPMIPEHCEQPFHMFYLIMPSEKARNSLISHLRDSGILAVFHYQPLHLSRMGKSLGGRKGDCPVAEDVSTRLLRLPFYNDLESTDQDRIIDAVVSFHP